MNNFLRGVFFILAFLQITPVFSQIDRKSVVARHNVILKSVDTLSSLTVGNGKFAYTVDVTGLQSFPEYYAKGVPLGTQSEWGWHSFPNPENLKFSETLKPYDFNGKADRLYSVQINEPARNKNAVSYFRENPARLQLGNVGLELLKKDGSIAKPQDLEDIYQELNPWTGEIISNFSLEGNAVKVITIADAEKDIISVKITSDLLKQKRIKVRFRFPYPSNQFTDVGTNYKKQFGT
ncbi:hypothetical protein L0657_22795 [Dyadobacter sp. CY345]|uniref:hypothetical protein n=1 Tax=Dyadobacter sp. CY345 TaxID=2909335 RepID=UPI001F3885DB|nr:hypothetical protein [Dyadobacter sp. CY345]MCF2446802.1 hypothetical protein [Dyadobacter sp. CY345]